MTNPANDTDSIFSASATIEGCHSIELHGLLLCSISWPANCQIQHSPPQMSAVKSAGY